MNVFFARCVARTRNRFIEIAHERKAFSGRLLLGTMRQDEKRDAERIGTSPVPGSFIRAASPDDRAAFHDRLVEELLIRARRFAAVLGPVPPRSAENPVVQPLASLSEPG